MVVYFGSQRGKLKALRMSEAAPNISPPMGGEGISMKTDAGEQHPPGPSTRPSSSADEGNGSREPLGTNPDTVGTTKQEESGGYLFSASEENRQEASSAERWEEAEPSGEQAAIPGMLHSETERAFFRFLPCFACSLSDVYIARISCDAPIIFSYTEAFLCPLTRFVSVYTYACCLFCSACGFAGEASSAPSRDEKPVANGIKGANMETQGLTDIKETELAQALASAGALSKASQDGKAEPKVKQNITLLSGNFGVRQRGRGDRCKTFPFLQTE